MIAASGAPPAEVETAIVKPEARAALRISTISPATT